MRKRLRKKKQLKEFTCYGFAFQVGVDPAHDKYDVFDALVKLFRAWDWQVGGTLGDENFYLVVCENRASTSMRHTMRNVDAEFIPVLHKIPGIRGSVIGPVLDANDKKVWDENCFAVLGSPKEWK